ncbi:MAG: hypothetical protein CMM48_10290 [Rhodospirillaceae bacterium]|nr:hypothetical protein [Rhodospirillaceae bacterium]
MADLRGFVPVTKILAAMALSLFAAVATPVFAQNGNQSFQFTAPGENFENALPNWNTVPLGGGGGFGNYDQYFGENPITVHKDAIKHFCKRLKNLKEELASQEKAKSIAQNYVDAFARTGGDPDRSVSYNWRWQNRLEKIDRSIKKLKDDIKSANKSKKEAQEELARTVEEAKKAKPKRGQVSTPGGAKKARRDIAELLEKWKKTTAGVRNVIKETKK